MAARKKVDETKDSDVELGSRDLSEGSEGSDVEVIQSLVLTEATGTYDAATVKAVKVWQKHRGLTPTGNITAADWKRALIDLEREPSSP